MSVTFLTNHDRDELEAKINESKSEYIQPEWGNTEGYILPETEVSLYLDDEMVLGAIYSFTNEIIAEENYTVIYDNKEYEVTSTEVDDGEIVLGNAGAILGGEDTGEPFIILYMTDSEGALLVPINQTEGVVRISIIGTVIETIPSEYVQTPEAPYIDLIELGMATVTVDGGYISMSGSGVNKIFKQVKLGLKYGALQARIKITGAIGMPVRGVHAKDVTYTDEEHLITIQLVAPGITKFDDNISVDSIFGSCVYLDCVILFEFTESQINIVMMKIAYSQTTSE